MEHAHKFILDISLQLDIEILGSEKDIGFRKTGDRNLRVIQI